MHDLMIRKVAVLGAGVMGAQIAAHCANAGFHTLLYDLAGEEKNRNSIVDKALKNLIKLKPAPLGNADTLAGIFPKNYQDNCEELKNADLIIEAIGERLEWKESLYKKIAPFINDKTILVSNTSGLSINTLSNFLPDDVQTRFCGVHFFNPPRYMHLVELIPAAKTTQALLDKLGVWLTHRLGKGVVRAKDTPNFIANRIGVFSLLTTMHYAQQLSISPAEVDLLTGELIGRPKSATFRTMDVVGLDTLQHVVDTMHNELSADPWHSLFQLPKWIKHLINKGRLGQKSGEGIYKKNGVRIEVVSTDTGEYEPIKAEISPELAQILKEKDGQKRMQRLLASEDKHAQFLALCYRDLFHYCAYHLADIAESVADIDLAMRWGFGWNKGPFEIWQESGFSLITDFIQEKNNPHRGNCLPQWMHEVSSFYSTQGAFSPHKGFLSRDNLAIYQRQLSKQRLPEEKQGNEAIVYENEGVVVNKINNDILTVAFKTKANTFNSHVLEGLNEALTIAENEYKGLIIHQKSNTTFSAGADLQYIALLMEQNKKNSIEQLIHQFQQTVMRIKYSAVPVVAAVRGKALGGGCELLMHSNAVCAFESYPGLVEIGVGLIPAGGGCKELALRAAALAGGEAVFNTVQKFFQQVATGYVASSALDAKTAHFLQDNDAVVMHRDEVLHAAISKITYLLNNNYQPPVAKYFKVAGLEGAARLQAGLVNWLEGDFISAHDYHIALKIAHILCGGSVNEGTLVDEWWLMELERKAFMELVDNTLTQQRITHLLATGKHLRN